MHLRYLAPGWNASPEKQATYQEAIRTFKPARRLTSTLPAGATWVKPFRIGSKGEEPAEVAQALAEE
jgi:hypothetical protein